MVADLRGAAGRGRRIAGQGFKCAGRGFRNADGGFQAAGYGFQTTTGTVQPMALEAFPSWPWSLRPQQYVGPSAVTAQTW